MAADVARPLANVRKIAVLRASALGDFIFALPALGALRRAYPQAEIVYLGKPWHVSFVPDHVTVMDRVVAVPPYPGVGEPENSVPDAAQLETFFARMQDERFDLALQLHGGGRHSNPFLLRLGAARTAGLRTPDAPPLDISIPYVFYQHEVLRLLEVVSHIGAVSCEVTPRLLVTSEDHHRARPVATQAGTRPYVIIHPGASDSRRRWPAERFAVTASQLLDEGYAVFVTGVQSERKVAQAVTNGTGGRAINLCGTLSLSELTGLIASAALVVSNDTGPLHLAAAVGTKSVGIYWIGNMITASQAMAANHRPLVSWTTHCPVCGRVCVSPASYPFDRACAHRVSFVGDVMADQVMAACRELLNQPAEDKKRELYA
jgi:ADP-heptose:LPS heptosyltransferase